LRAGIETPSGHMEYNSRLEQAAKSGVLHLSHLDLEEIPKEVFSLTNLVRLDVGWNQIRCVPDEIAQLSKLEELWLNNNPVSIRRNLSLTQKLLEKIVYCFHRYSRYRQVFLIAGS